jgi:type IV secretory pathway VirD2 relaxase
MAAQVIESTVHSKVCVWKLDLEIAASARALGDASRALMIATRVRQVASSVGANRVAAVARRIQASFGTSPTAETRALGRKYDQLDTKQRASDLATNPRKLEVGGG